jgi:enoyl-CoA hydratase/carnithine racemase
MTDEILFDERRQWGVITLNRPAALNALTLGMVQAFHAQLMKWEAAPHIKAVMVKGAGEKAFCAGGDIRWLHDTAKEDADRARDFFRAEYKNNAAIYHFPKPYVAMIDGIVMGGGVGVSVHGDFRVVGDKTLFAMPETGIGLFPDVGGGHFMPRLHDGLGLYYALTGARAKAADCMAAGIATHYCPSGQTDALENALLERSLGGRPHADIEAVLDEFAGDPGDAHINDIRPSLKRLFEGAETLEALMSALKADGHDVANDILRVLSRMSPTSLKLTFEQMRRGRGLDIDYVLRMEFRMVSRVLGGHDFFEGVRALIIDKDKAPVWAPASVEGVGEQDIARYFAPLSDKELQL